MSYATLRQLVDESRRRSERWQAAKLRLYDLAEAAGVDPPANIRENYAYQCWPIYDPRKGYKTLVKVQQDIANPDLWCIRTGDFGGRYELTAEEVVAILLAGLPTNDPEQMRVWNPPSEETNG